MSVSPSEPPLSDALRAPTGGAADLRLVPEPSRAQAALVADLLWPTTRTPEVERDEVRGRLLGLLRPLLAARRSTVLRWEHERAYYTVWQADATGVLQPTGATVAAQAAPLPLVAAQGTGVLVACPRQSAQVDPAVAALLGGGPALLAPLPGAHGPDDLLALSLGAVPRAGELALALALIRRAAALLAGRAAADRPVVSGGRAARGRRAPGQLTAASRGLGLSPREREVVQLVAAGLRNKEIALRLQISEKTVKFHLGRIFDKLGVDSRTELLLRLIAEGGLVPGDPRTRSGSAEATRCTDPRPAR